MLDEDLDNQNIPVCYGALYMFVLPEHILLWHRNVASVSQNLTLFKCVVEETEQKKTSFCKYVSIG